MWTRHVSCTPALHRSRCGWEHHGCPGIGIDVPFGIGRRERSEADHGTFPKGTWSRRCACCLWTGKSLCDWKRFAEGCSKSTRTYAGCAWQGLHPCNSGAGTDVFVWHWWPPECKTWARIAASCRLSNAKAQIGWEILAEGVADWHCYGSVWGRHWQSQQGGVQRNIRKCPELVHESFVPFRSCKSLRWATCTGCIYCTNLYHLDPPWRMTGGNCGSLKKRTLTPCWKPQVSTLKTPSPSPFPLATRKSCPHQAVKLVDCGVQLHLLAEPLQHYWFQYLTLCSSTTTSWNPIPENFTEFCQIAEALQ